MTAHLKSAPGWLDTSIGDPRPLGKVIRVAPHDWDFLLTIDCEKSWKRWFETPAFLSGSCCEHRACRDTVALVTEQTVWELDEPFMGHTGTDGADVHDEHGNRVGVINAVDGRVFKIGGRL
jgi:hypothetical protein